MTNQLSIERLYETALSGQFDREIGAPRRESSLWQLRENARALEGREYFPNWMPVVGVSLGPTSIEADHIGASPLIISYRSRGIFSVLCPTVAEDVIMINVVNRGLGDSRSTYTTDSSNAAAVAGELAHQASGFFRFVLNDFGSYR